MGVGGYGKYLNISYNFCSLDEGIKAGEGSCCRLENFHFKQIPRFVCS